jgi:hypothetical protein
MIKAGLSIAAGEDPLAAYSEYQDWMDSVEPENKRFIGGMLASGHKMEPKVGPLATWFEKRKNRRNPQPQEASILPTAQPRQPFNWDAFIQNLRLNTVGQQGGSPLDSFNQINPNFLNPRTQTFTPQIPNVNVTPLNPGIPGPGGPTGLNGTAMNMFAGGGRVGPQNKDVPQLDPQTLDILGRMLDKHGSGNFNTKNQYEQQVPPMPEWMQDPEIIRMMQETFGGKSPLERGDVPQFDSFQDVIDGRESGYAKGGKVKSPAWQRKEGKNPEGGLNAKGRASYNAQTGGNLKAPQPEGGSRKDSFCARMGGMKKKLTSKKTANDPDSRINKALKKWNCYAGGGRIGPVDRPGLPSVEPDESNWLALLGLQNMFESEPPTSFEDNITDADLDRAEQLARRSVDEIRRSTPFVAERMRNENADLRNKINANTNLDRPRSPLDEMVERITKRTMIPREAPMLNEIYGDDTQREPPIFDDRWRDYEKFLNNIDPSKPLQGEYKKFTPTKKRPPIEFEPIEDGRIGRDMEERARRMILENARKKKYPDVYAAGGAVSRFQEGGFVEGGNSFKGKGKSQARVPAEGIDPLAALYYGMNSSAGTFQPDFQNLGRDDVLAQTVDDASVGEGTITKAQARNQTPRFESFQDVLDELPPNPNDRGPGAKPPSVPMRSYSNSRMWGDVNEDLFLEGTKMNEQDNRIKNKLLSTNPDTQAFSQYQFLPKTWNAAVAKIDPETRKRLNINPVSASEIKKYESGDARLASVLPSQEAVDYVYKTDYLPQSYNNLKKANIPITELNLYLAHHLGYNGAPNAIPLLYDEKYKDTPMKDVLYKAGLKSAATRKGNPWSYDKNPKLTFGQYRKMKEKAYNELREKYKGKTLDELTPEDIPLNDPSRGGETINGGTTTFNPIKIIGDYFTQGGKGFSGGGYVKKFSRGGSTDEPLYRAPLEDWDEVFRRQYGDDSLVLPLEDWEKFMPAPPEVTADEIDLYKSIPKGNRANLSPNKVNVINDFTVTTPKKAPRGPNVLRMPENPADWKTREPGIFEKVMDRAKRPEVLGWVDDFMHDITGGWASPSSSGKRPTDQKIVLPIDEKGWDYKPNPNLYMDALGEWGSGEDPVDAFYREMGDKIGYPTGEQQGEVPGGDGTATGGAPGAPGGSTESGNPLENEYNKMLEEYLAYKKPEKGKVFGLFSDVNEPLLKLGLSLLASKGSFGEALGEAGLSSLKDREMEQFKVQKEKSDRLKEILDIRYKQAQMEAMDPSNKLALAQAQAGYRQTLQDLKLQNALDMLDLKGASASKRAILEGLVRKALDDPEGLSPEQIEYLQEEGFPITPVQDPGTSL